MRKIKYAILVTTLGLMCSCGGNDASKSKPTPKEKIASKGGKKKAKKSKFLKNANLSISPVVLDYKKSKRDMDKMMNELDALLEEIEK